LEDKDGTYLFKDGLIPQPLYRETLTTFHIHNNELKDETANQIAAYFGCNPESKEKKVSSLTALNVSYNQITDEGAKSFSDFLISHDRSQITNLYLGVNKISNDGIISISNALKSNTILQILNLSFNEFGAVGGKALLSSLSSNTTLRVMYLNDQGSPGCPPAIEEEIKKLVGDVSRQKKTADLEEEKEDKEDKEEEKKTDN